MIWATVIYLGLGLLFGLQFGLHMTNDHKLWMATGHRPYKTATVVVYRSSITRILLGFWFNIQLDLVLSSSMLSILAQYKK